MATTRLLIDDALIVVIFPETPAFNQWMMPNYQSLVRTWTYGIEGKPWVNEQGYRNPVTILVNWADGADRLNLHVASYPYGDTKNFVHSSEFEFLKSSFDGVTMRGRDHVIFNDPQDVIMFRLRYGDSIKAI
jgi:hypothetical protein